MSDSIDIAGSEEIISVNNETQDTFSDLSYRPKQVNNRLEKKDDLTQAKENQKPMDQVDEPIDGLASQATPPPTSSQDLQNNPFSIRAAAVKSTLTDGSSQETDQNDEMQTETTDDDKTKDSNTTTLDTSTAATNLRLYISPCTSLLETTNAEDAPSNGNHTSSVEKTIEKEPDEKPKNEPMDTNDAQMSLGSDGIILSQENDSKSVSTSASSDGKTSPTAPKTRTQMSPSTKASYAFSQPTTDKFEAMLAKLKTSPARPAEKKKDEHVIVREEEELFIRETVSKIVRRYTVRLDPQGRTISRDLMDERVVEENTTTRIESWPSMHEKIAHSVKIKPIEPTVVEPIPTATSPPPPTTTTTTATKKAATQQQPQAKKKTAKITTPKRKAKSLKPVSTTTTTTTTATKRRAKAVLSDDDEPKKIIQLDDTSDEAGDDKAGSENDNNDDEDDDEENTVTEDLDGEEFIPPLDGIAAKPIRSGSRIFAQWRDGRFYPGVVSNLSGEKYMIQFDDGGKRTVKPHEIICQSYLPADQPALAQKPDRYYEEAIVKRLIKKKKSDALGYVVEIEGKQRWYPLMRISLTSEQAEKLPFLASKSEEPTTTAAAMQRKRKRTSPPSQSPAKKSKSTISTSPTKLPRTTFTPTRSTKLFNSMYFLLTGFNDMMETRHRIEDNIESHGGQVIEKMPSASRRDRVYLISDIARKTAKFFEAKKLNVPCVNYKWIEESVDKMDVQDLETFRLIPVEKETNSNNDEILDAQKED